MGGYNSGRRSGGSTVEDGLTISLPMMMQHGWVRDGQTGQGSQYWSRNGTRFASIGHSFDMREPNSAWLKLTFRWTPYGGEARDVKQHIPLVSTRPNYGGRRWWMLCPITDSRVGKLHLPPGGGVFASRKAWRLGYQSQRNAHHDRSLENLFRLQRKLGCDEGWGNFVMRPKGMWHRTFEQHLHRYFELHDEVELEMQALLNRLRPWSKSDI